MFTPQTTGTGDSIANVLHVISRVCLIIGVSLLPILLIPIVNVPILDGKIFVTVLGVSLAVLFSALLVLRLGSLQIPASATMSALWLVAVAAIVSAALSGDVSDSLATVSGSAYTAATISIGAFVLTVTAIGAQHVATARWVLMLLGLSSATLVVWHVLRLVTGLDLSFGIFPAQTSSVLGSWNDVAILSAAVVLALLLVLTQARTVLWQRVCVLVLLAAALFLLLTINNTVLWSILGIVSLTIVVMALTRRHVERTPSMLTKQSTHGAWLLGAATMVFAATLMVMLGGDSLQRTLTQATDSDFVEVRPSVGASLDIVRAVWSEQALVGVGPGKFADAWRMHKSPSINESIFWNTDFAFAHNSMLTYAVETGLLGVVAWLVFFGALVVSGLRTFLFVVTPHKDNRYQLALIAFVLSCFIWISFFFAVPGVPLFIIAAAVTGLYIGLSFGIRPRQLFAVSLLQNQRLGFLVVATLVVVIVAVVWFLQQMAEQLIASTRLNQAFATTAESATVESVSSQLNAAFELRRTDTAARADALLQLSLVQQLLQQTEPTAEDQQRFQRAVVGSVNSSNAAVQLDPSDPENWYTQVRVYTVLAQAAVEGASERAEAALAELDRLDPINPRVSFARAELALLNNDAAAARSFLTETIQRKSNYTPALFALAQLEIAEGNVPEAIAVTRSILSFEPQNPARWYQLGVLYQANQEPENAIQALSQAITLDPDYANALYIRGLLRASVNDTAGAEADLSRVQALNPDNQTVATQLELLRTGDLTAPTEPVPVDDLNLEDETSDTDTVSEAAAQSDLVTTTTNAPAAEQETAEADATEQ